MDHTSTCEIENYEPFWKKEKLQDQLLDKMIFVMTLKSQSIKKKTISSK